MFYSTTSANNVDWYKQAFIVIGGISVKVECSRCPISRRRHLELAWQERRVA